MGKEGIDPLAQQPCLCQEADVLLIACSGGSDCGQVTAEAAVQLTREGLGEVFCLAGLAAHIPEMIETARQAARICVIDGCSLHCGRKAVEHVGLRVTDHVDLSAQGLPKSRDFRRVQQNVLFIAKLAKQMLAANSKGAGAE